MPWVLIVVVRIGFGFPRVVGACCGVSQEKLHPEFHLRILSSDNPTPDWICRGFGFISGLFVRVASLIGPAQFSTMTASAIGSAGILYLSEQQRCNIPSSAQCTRIQLVQANSSIASGVAVLSAVARGFTSLTRLFISMERFWCVIIRSSAIIS